MSKTDFMENALLNHVFGNTAYTAPATLYVALFTAAPSDAGGGTEVSTANWTNYARAAVTNNTTNFPAASAGSKSNGTSISFGTAATTGNIAVTHFAIFDAASAGNMLRWGTCSATVANGNTVSIAAGQLTFTED